MLQFDLTHFNPGGQNEDAFLANFIARQNEFNFFLAHLRATESGQAAKHHLILAPRGYGKTSLLRRIQIALRQEADLSERFIALAFREEQHNVISLDVFWRNCLQSLLEAREDENADAVELDALDALWHQHAPRSELKRDKQDGALAWHAFSEHCAKLGRRPVLLIDNLDALLAGLEQHQWGLRSILQQVDGPVLLTAASRYPDGLSDSKAAFFDFFRITTLPALGGAEVMSCLRKLADMRGERGAPVRAMLNSDPGRISALNTMAGGNPRTLGVLYSVLETQMSDDVLVQLNAMLDMFTGWYQARTEELPLQSRAVFDALALNWDPMTSAALGKVTGLDTPSVNSQLNRLEKSGYVEQVALSSAKKGRNGYQVMERFYNIWYLMRNGSRRTRQTIRFLTKFLQACFSRRELNDMAEHKLRQGHGRLESILALASLVRPARLRHGLLDQARGQVGDDADVSLLIDELGKKGQSKRVGQSMLDRLMSKAIVQRDNGELNEAEASLREAIALDKKSSLPWLYLGYLLHTEFTRYEEAVGAYRQAIALNGKTAMAWNNLGNLLSDHFDRYEEAESAYREALAQEEKNAVAWVNLGCLLGINLNRYGEAEIAYRQAIAHGDKSGWAWGHLGNLLQDHLGEYAAALQAYQQALTVNDDQYVDCNCAFVCALHMDQVDVAQGHAAKAQDHIAPVVNHLVQAALRWSGGDAAQAGWQEVQAALNCNDPELWRGHLYYLQRVLAYATARGDAAFIRQSMIDSNYPSLYAPLYHAYCALTDGPDHLLTINPEVRPMAEKIYRKMADMLIWFERDKAATATKKSKR